MDGLDYIVPERESDRVLNRRLFQADCTFRVLPDICQRRGVVVQAGGNWGCWPVNLAKMFDVVYTFEPDFECFTCLTANTSHLPNVVRIQAALGNKRALVDLWRDVDTTGNQKVEGKGIYPTLLIDDLGLETCDLIYLDIEGMEYDALVGGIKTIDRCRPIVIYEGRKKFVNEVRKAEAFLEQRKYVMHSIIGADAVMVPRECEAGIIGVGKIS